MAQCRHKKYHSFKIHFEAILAQIIIHLKKLANFLFTLQKTPPHSVNSREVFNCLWQAFTNLYSLVYLYSIIVLFRVINIIVVL